MTIDIEKLRKVATITLTAEPDPTPLRGNALASGDPVADREYEDRLIARLNDGDIWAWCVVTVTASWNGVSASDSLGGNSYDGEDDFCQEGGYYSDMVNEALGRLAMNLDGLLNAIERAQFATGTTRPDLFVVETCHDGTAMCVRRATPEEVAEENQTAAGWAMPYENALSCVKESVKGTPMRWYDFSAE